MWFQHTAARRRLDYQKGTGRLPGRFQHTAARRRLANEPLYSDRLFLFQHTAARRRLVAKAEIRIWACCFNTQPPEGGWLQKLKSEFGLVVSTHSRPKAAGKLAAITFLTLLVSTHSRPKAAGHTHLERKAVGMFQHTAARRRLEILHAAHNLNSRFQHTAARRRLAKVT